MALYKRQHPPHIFIASIQPVFIYPHIEVRQIGLPSQLVANIHAKPLQLFGKPVCVFFILNLVL